MLMAENLNHGCLCHTLDAQQLHDQITQHAPVAGLADQLVQTHPHLFSPTVVFISHPTHDAICETIAAIERIAALPAYQAQALAHAPEMARKAWGPRGVFMGYDFHVTAQGPQLIEINTNAGGALLNALLANAQKACCEPLNQVFTRPEDQETYEQVFFAMFLQEWRSQRKEQTLRTVVVVDDDPKSQYLAPEFEMFRHFFLRHGIQAEVADPKALEWRDGQLWLGDMTVDLVYNRLTDFYLTEPAHLALLEAYQAGAAVFTPHPHAHALLADKRHLITLGNQEALAALGVSAQDQQVLARTVPAACRVSTENAVMLWAQRRQYFFKPVAGFGSKAVYRGDKLTQRVWQEILAGDYIAQTTVAPGHRLVMVDGVATDLKYDLRAYTYNAHVQLVAARIYQGQTTNFRTPGGGFSPVIVLPEINPMTRLIANLPASLGFSSNKPSTHNAKQGLKP
jgi:hypothetical protein